MNRAALVILVHQAVFQGMFLAKNALLRRRLGVPIRGRNREAAVATVVLVLFIVASFALALLDSPPGTVVIMNKTTALIVASVLIAINTLLGAAALLGLRDSWRVGVPEGQKTALIESGIYRFSRNPYFLSYILMLVGYTVLLQSAILAALALVGLVVIHVMIRKEEKHLEALHGDAYREYRRRVPRYFII